MPKVAPQYKDDAKKRIILAAMEVMAESGYDKFTIDDVAKKIGATKGAVYWYFQNKNALIQEVLENIENELEKIASDPFFDHSDNINFPSSSTRFLFSNAEQKELLSEIGLPKNSYDGTSALNPEYVQKLIAILESQIETGQKKGQFPSLSDKKTLALILVVLCSGLQKGEIYTVLFLGRTGILKMWFTAMKKLLNP
jgi:AcrR family transcriptional regulator